MVANKCKCPDNVELRNCDFHQESNSSEVDNEGRRLQCQWVEIMVPVEIHRDGPQSPWGFRYPTLYTFFKYFLTYIFHVVRLRGGSDVEGGTPLEIIKVS